MWIAQCNVCCKNLPGVSDGPHFCDRCFPYAQAWAEGLIKIGSELKAEETRRVNKFRAQFLQETVLAKKQELKAV